jgi:DNA-binding NtrC family response regulator
MNQSSRLCILVVDQDEVITETLVRIFSELGYYAACTKNANSAISLLSGIQIDVLVENLPSHFEHGTALTKVAKLIQPHIKVIVMSGSCGLTHYSHPSVDAFLQIPFTMAKLKEIIQSVLRKPQRWPLELSQSGYSE